MHTTKKIKISIAVGVLAVLLALPLLFLLSKKPITTPSGEQSGPLTTVAPSTPQQVTAGVPTTYQQSPTPPQPTDSSQTTASQFAAEAQAEKLRAQEQVQTLKLYPWIDNLPISTKDYFVYFDTTTKHFTAKIYQSDYPGMDVPSVKNAVLTALTNLGVKTGDYTIDWIIQ